MSAEPGSEGVTLAELRQSENELSKLRRFREVIQKKGNELYPESGLSVTEKTYAEYFSSDSFPIFHLEAIKDQRYREAFTEDLEILVKYLDLPVIDDELKNNQEFRRTLRRALSGLDLSQEGGHQTNDDFTLAFDNKRRGNVLHKVLTAMSDFVDYFDTYLQQNNLNTKPEISGAYSELYEVYSQLPPVSTYDAEDTTEQMKREISDSMPYAVVEMLKKVANLLYAIKMAK